VGFKLMRADEPTLQRHMVTQYGLDQDTCKF
jgi:hypothetical protein